MDIDKEMERLTREAREKGERERAAQEAELKTASDEAKKAADALRAAAREGVAEDDAEDDGKDGPIGMQILAVIGAIVVAFMAWKLLVAPLISLAITLGMIALVVWVILKLAGFGAKT